MEHKRLLLSLVMGFVAVVTAEDSEEYTPPPLPMFTSVMVETSEGNSGAFITVEYEAPERPDALWFVNDLPIPEGRVDYAVYNNFGQTGQTELSSLRDKWSQFGVCLQNVVGEVCLELAPLPPHGVVRQELHFPWPLMTPGPLVRYADNETLRIHAPVMDTPYNYTYSALLFSKNPYSAHGRLVEAESRGMVGGKEGDKVTVGPVNRGTGWMLVVRTDLATYEGVLIVNTTYRPQAGLVEACSLFRPFTIYHKNHTSPFKPGFVAPIHRPLTWRCHARMACMIVCLFLSNGDVNVTVSRTSVNAVLNAEQLPAQPDELRGVTRMLGPYFGYSAVFLPAFDAERDAGLYKCAYKTSSTRVSGMVEVD